MPPVDRDELGELPPSPPSHPPEPFSEFEQDDLASESTSIDDRDALATESTQILREMPSMPLLFVESGRDQGREYVLVEGETTVGRGIDNEVILADVSVSRRHLRVLRDGDSLQLRDAGSGNGTLVNGRRVHAVALSDGDRIELGETVLVVRVPGAELATSFPHDQDVLRTMDNTTDETAVPMAGPSFDQSLAPHDGGSWSLPPPMSSLPPSGPSATSWIGQGGERTSSIVLDRRTLVIVGAVIAIGASVLSALVVAVVLRRGEPTPVASTLPHEPGAPIAVPPMAIPVQPAVPPVVARPTPPVVAPTPPIVPTANVEEPAPGAPDTDTRAQARADAPEPRREVRSTPVREGRAQTTPVREAPPERTSRERAPREVPTPPARSRGGEAYLAAYRSGDFATASREARNAGQAARALHIDQFATHYRTAQSAEAGSATATRAIERAIGLDNQIVPGGHYGARLRGQLVSAYLASAESAMGARPQDACRRVQLALRLEARNARGLTLGRQCETQAQRLLGEAAGAERSDPARARALYQAVLPMVGASSATYTRARQRVDALGRARGVDEDE